MGISNLPVSPNQCYGRRQRRISCPLVKGRSSPRRPVPVPPSPSPRLFSVLKVGFAAACPVCIAHLFRFLTVTFGLPGSAPGPLPFVSASPNSSSSRLSTPAVSNQVLCNAFSRVPPCPRGPLDGSWCPGQAGQSHRSCRPQCVSLSTAVYLLFLTEWSVYPS